MVLQTNGKSIIGREFTTINGSPHKYLARLNTDGSTDATFDSPSVPDSELVDNIALQPDGKILVCGTFGSWNGVPYYSVVRLRPDGSVDANFNPVQLSSYGRVESAAGQSDGKVVIGGDFTSVNGTNRNHVARLNTNGSLDLTFNPGTGANDIVTAVALQSNGKAIVGGDFTTMNGATCSHLARLNSDGSLDTNFTASVAPGNANPYTPTVRFINVLSNDKFLIGGSLSSVSGYSRKGIALVDADGSVDTTFNPGSGASLVSAAAVQADGKVLVGGSFLSFNGVPSANVVRLLTNGAVDVGFNVGSGNSAGSSVYGVAAQQDGKVIIGGNFYRFNGTSINSIARLNGDGSTSTNLQFLEANQYFGTFLQGTISNTYRVEWTTNFNTPSLWTPLFNVTLQTNPQFILDPMPISGKRFYRAVQLSP